MKEYSERTQGSMIEQRGESTVQFRIQGVEADFSAEQSKVLIEHLKSDLLPYYPIDIVRGRHCVEVKPS
jgi:trehalose-6-phosphatase